MSDKLPKVSIAVVGVVIAQIGGFIWWTAQQASTIANLEETVNVLTVENNATDKTNLIRDVEQNSENIDEIIDYIVELEDEGEQTAVQVYDEIELIWEDMGGFTEQFMEIIKLQARIAVLEKTVEFNRKDGM
ncbi:MAG: hypothetical protein P8L17_01040 [Methylophilaceae bacterium]|nr:hypothetical protein [Methylophilaceae bacterium]